MHAMTGDLKRTSIRTSTKFIAWPVLAASVNITVVAQTIMSDGTVNSTVTPNNNTYEITDGTKLGTNLFHSFSRFDLDTGFEADFRDTVGGGISNILSRVTGHDQSNINGLIRSSIDSANLFLINPSGIVFGENAQLNISGSFYASTADELRFAGDSSAVFSATDPGKSGLSSAPPEAFGFLSSNPSPIAVENTMSLVKAVRNLSFIGGPVRITEGIILAPSASFNIVSAGGPGEAKINGDIIDLQPGQARGPIEVSGSSIDTTGRDGGHTRIIGGNVRIEQSDISANNDSAPGRGITIDADNVTLNALLLAQSNGTAPAGDIKISAGELISTNDSFIETGLSGDISITTGALSLNNTSLCAGTTDCAASTEGGDINILAEREVALLGGSFITTRTSSGQAGNISVTAGNLNLDRSTINNDVFTGEGGNITLDVREGITLSESRISSRAVNSDAGNVRITTRTLNLRERAMIEGTTGGSGRGADVVVRAAQGATLEGEETTITTASGREQPATGQGGSISINTPLLTVDDGAEINANANSIGRGGDITVTAPEGEVAVTGVGSAITTASLVTDQNAGIAGPAGRIMIEAGRFVVRDGGEVSARTETTGAGGDLVVIADSVLLDGQNSGVSVDSRGTAAQSGNSGNLRLVTNDTLEIRNQARVSADTLGPGAGGDVAIESPDIRLSSGGTISARTRGSGRGGNIEINEINGKSGTVSLSGPSTSISSETTGDGDAGRIAIRTGRLTVRDDAEISASTDGNGRGGSVTIQASNIELLNGGEIEARSDGRNDSAQSGNLSIRADDTIRIFNGSSINVETRQARAGDIALNAGFLLHLRDNGRVSTSARGGTGDGGNISIDPVFTILDQRSRITAEAFRGRGGNIRISTDFLFAPPDSISASSDFGVSGNVEIDSPDTDVISGALALPESFLDAASLLSDRCSARTAKGASSFIVSGRGGVPPGPETVLPSYNLNLSEAPQVNQGANAISADRLCNR